MSDVQKPGDAAAGDETPAAKRDRPSAGRTAMLWFFLVACGLAGAGFCWKIHEFFADALAEEGIGFAGPHLFTYALVAGGYILLLAAAFFRGHLADIEQPKYDLIERECRNDLDEFASARS